MEVIKLKEGIQLLESNEEPKVYMNTWKNYNENGADVDRYANDEDGLTGGWMSLDKAVEFAERYAEDEPFINDTDNIPFSVSEYDNVEEVAEKVERYESLDEQEKEALQCYLDTQSDDFDAAIDCIESQDYIYLEGVTNDYDLGYENVEMIGSIQDAASDPSMYIDWDAYRRDVELEFDDSDLRDDFANRAYQDTEDAYPELDYESDEFKEHEEERLEQLIDENRDTYIDEYVNIAQETAESGDWPREMYERYFDYEAFGRDLRFDGWSYGKNGAILIQ